MKRGIQFEVSEYVTIYPDEVLDLLEDDEVEAEYKSRFGTGDQGYRKITDAYFRGEFDFTALRREMGENAFDIAVRRAQQ